MTDSLFDCLSIVVVTFFNHNFVNCKATLILEIKIYEIKYNIRPKSYTYIAIIKQLK